MRDYDTATDQVSKFYEENHRKQTLDFVLQKKAQFAVKHYGHYQDIWDVLDLLDTLVDESDPDTENSQTQHALQSAEAARQAGASRVIQLVCLIHDCGKMMSLNGEPQWAVVGDTFPVGCRFSDLIIYHQYFESNPDNYSELGIYQKNCGLDQVHFSWGHDEYLYQVCKDILPEEALYIIRYHSFYAGHKERAYGYLMSDKDHKMMELVREFNQYDLYSKSAEKVDVKQVKPYYHQLLKDFFPNGATF